MKDRAKIVDFYLQKLSDKNFEISDVRKDLEKNSFDEAEIRIIVRLVDNELQRRLFIDSHNRKSFDLVYIGAILTFLGAGFTIATYTGLINMGDSFLIAYGPFLGGLSILMTGLAKRIKSKD
jgi:hypothetical protein